MTLEDVVNGRKSYSKIAKLNEAIEKDATNPELHKGLLDFYTNTYGMTENDAKVLLSFKPGRDYSAPEDARFYSEQALREQQNQLITASKDNLEAIIDGADLKKLVEFAADLPDKSKNHLKIQEAAAKGDIGTIADLLFNRYKNPIWQAYIDGLAKAAKEMPAEESIKKQLSTLMENYIHDSRSKFVNENLCDEIIENDGEKKKTKYVANADRTRAYVRKMIKSYKPTDEYMEQMYLRLASTLN